MRKVCVVFLLLVTVSVFSQRGVVPAGELNFSSLMQPVNTKWSILQSEDYFTWGGSPIRDKKGMYHLYYSRWKKEYGFLAWVTHSEIAHAVSKNPLGPYVFKDVALPARGANYWDGLYTHNPTIHYFGGKYYLYYTGNTGDGKNIKNGLNWSHRNNQRLGVAVSKSPNGPWKRFDKPIIDVSSNSLAYDALMMANPSISKMPDGKYLLVYKAVGKRRPLPSGGPVVHLCAVSESPLGPFKKHNLPIFTDGQKTSFPAEDPYIWYQDNCFYAIVKDMNGTFTKQGRSLALFYSLNGMDWQLAKHPLVSKLKFTDTDGKTYRLQHLERPQLLIENGVPSAIFFAADSMKNYATQPGHSFNVHIPLKWNR